MNELKERPSNLLHVRQSPRKETKDTTVTSERSLGGKENVFPAPAAMSDAQRCWDWIVVQGSIHFARDRAFFTTYKSLQNTTTPSASSAPRPVIGIGTVKLEVVTSTQPNATIRTITLKNVLHMPTALYNGFCAKRQGDIQSFDHPIQAWDKFGRPSWCTKDFWGWQRVIIAGHNEGISPIREAALRLGKEEGCLFAN